MDIPVGGQKDIPLVGDLDNPLIGKRVKIARFSATAFTQFLKGIYGGVQVVEGQIPQNARVIGTRVDSKFKYMDFLIEDDSFALCVGPVPFLDPIAFRSVNLSRLQDATKAKGE